MNNKNENFPDGDEALVQDQTKLLTDQPVHVPLYRRDINPTNLVLSAQDLKEFCELLSDVNVRAKEIELSMLDISKFESIEIARQRVNEAMPIDYKYVAGKGDSVQGQGIPRTEERSFPEDLVSLFVSNSTYTDRAFNFIPLNTVNAFISFEKPSLKIDFLTLPSNPTNNRSLINVEGRNEDWVISTKQKIDEFFKNRTATRSIIHGSGVYDYIVYLAFLPMVIWLFNRSATLMNSWLEQQTVFLNVILGIYFLLISLLFARFLFQYARWLFPPMEYFKQNRWPAFIHRTAAGFVAATIAAGAIYDLVKAIYSEIFP